jgi:sec-independent protein translocase protein TatC
MTGKAVKSPGPPYKDDALPLLSHLIELRGRLLWCLAVFILGFIASYFYAEQIYAFLVEPLAGAMKAHPDIGQRRLIYTNLTEAFFAYLGVALWAAFFITSPFILLQIWRFLAPGLYTRERLLFVPYFVLTPVLFLAGAALAYYFVFPAAWGFFLSFENPSGAAGLPIQLEARVGEYLSLAMTLILAFGFAFEMPLALVLMVHVGLVTTVQLRQFRRYAIVGCFIIAAFITPPDVISQLSLAIPLCLLYEMAILFGWMLEKANKISEKEE